MTNLNLLLEQYKTIDPKTLEGLNRRQELFLTYSSCAMEGSTLTLEEVVNLIEQGIKPKGKPEEHILMIQDHHEAVLFIKDLATSFNQISEHIIKKIGALVMKSTGGVYNSILGTVDSRNGDFRVSASRASGGSYYVAHEKIKPMMDDLYKYINDRLSTLTSIEEALSLSTHAHLQLLTIHSFVDGNGRSARLLQNLILSKYHFPLLLIRSENKPAYIEAIKASRNSHSIGPLQDFLFEEYVFGLKRDVGF